MNLNRFACLALGGACVLARASAGGMAGLGPEDFSFDLRAARNMVADSPYAPDSAGERLAFETNATNLILTVRYARRNGMPDHKYVLDAGEWRVDGRLEMEFSRPAREDGERTVALSLDGPQRMRRHEILLPLADQAEFLKLAADAGSTACRACPPAPRTLVAYGDSITQGFFATRPSCAYPARLAQATGWNVLNLGFCGRKTTPRDALAIAALKPDGIIVMMGVNDAIFGTDPDTFCSRYLAFLVAIARNCPGTPVWVVTPTSATGRKYKTGNLEEYRNAIRDSVAKLGPPFHLLEGPDLLPARSELFADGLHPNDPGFEVLARALEAALRNEPAFRP